MALAIAVRQVGEVSILDLSGRIILGEGSVQLREAVRELVAKGARNILLNLTDVFMVDSSGVGELALALKAARHNGGDVKLLKPSGKVLELLELTKLATVFEVFDDEAGAVGSFQ